MWSQLLYLLAVLLPASHASEKVFSVQDDVLAYPQFDIAFSPSYISEAEAIRRLGRVRGQGKGKVSVSVEELVGEEERSLRPLSSAHKPHEGGEGREESGRKTGGGGEEGGVEEEGEEEQEEQADYERMVLSGRPYLCALPRVKEGSAKQKNGSSAGVEQETDLALAAERGFELLRDLEGKCMFIVSGWWSYSFCYNSQVKQFHRLSPGGGGSMYPPQEDPSSPSYVLGQFGDKKADQGSEVGGGEPSAITELQVKGDTRYLVQKLGGGTTCDLTGKERKVEVQFHCHPQSMSRIGWIKEVATCTYLMIVYHPRLCNDVAFLPPRRHEAHIIDCREILKPVQVADWERQRSSEAEQQLIGNGNDVPLMAGDVEIGAMKEVGIEGRRIQKGRVVSPPEERVETIAEKKAGKVRRLSKEDLKKIGLNPGTVEEFRKEIQALAGDKDWRLEKVVDHRGAIHLRAVVADEDDEREIDESVDRDNEGPGKGSEEEYREDL